MSLDLKRQLIAQLVESSRLLRNYIDHRAKGRGTTRAQWIVLFRLRQQEGLSQVDLADVLELQPISLVRLLDRLVEHGLLERRPDPNDRRANRLFLTVGGRQLVDDLDRISPTPPSKPASRRSGTSRSGSRALPNRREAWQPSSRHLAILGGQASQTPWCRACIFQIASLSGSIATGINVDRLRLIAHQPVDELFSRMKPAGID
jgi:DNA-binding MarR family transcriptional regulator